MRHRWAFAAESLVILGSIAALVYFYVDFTRISDLPAQPPDPGEVKLYFNTPGVPALMEVHVSDADRSINVTVSADRSYEPDSVEFALVFTGRLARPPELPIEREQDARGCWKTVYVSLPDDRSTCVLVKGSSNGLPGNSKNVDQLVVSTRLDRNDSGAMFRQVTLYADHGYSTSAGKRTYFALPGMGTPYIPSRMRHFALDIATDHDMFAPATLDVIVEYRSLKSHEKIDSVAPDPFEAGELSWVEVDTALVRPHGSLVDIALEDAGQRRLYLIGVVIGLLAAVLPLVATSAWRRLAKVRSAT